jgi:hypothetical protein
MTSRTADATQRDRLRWWDGRLLATLIVVNAVRPQTETGGSPT